MWQVAAQVVFYSVVVAPLAAYLLARMTTAGILMSRRRFYERFPKSTNQPEKND